MQKIGIVGAGTMGGGIGQVAAAHGHRVVLYDNQGGAAEGIIHEIGKRVDRWSARGRLSRDQAASVLQGMSVADSLGDLAGSDLVIEAVAEDLHVKQELFAALEDIVDHDTILATNTSSLSITEIALNLRHPGRLVGMHFFNPAPTMRLVEIVSGELTSPDVAEACFELARKWEKHPVRCRSNPGFIGNFVNRPFYLEALRIREEGVADERTIDDLMVRSGGFRMGPFELMDLVGVDVNLAVSERVWEALGRDPRFEPSGIQRTMVKQKKLGRKTGLGFYSYDANTPPPRQPALAPGPGVTSIRVGPTAGGLEDLVERARNKNIEVNSGAELDGIEVEEVRLILNDGYTAREHTLGSAIPAVVVDWAHDMQTAPALGIASNVSPALSSASGFLAQLDIEAIRLNDRSGLVVARIIASIANLAAEAAFTGIASPEDIDTAMLLGFNYPEGPLAWATRVGSARLLAMLEQMGIHLDQARYRPTDGLQETLATSA